MDLRSKLLDPGDTALLYGTTPPRAGTAEDAVRQAADKLAARLAPLPIDGIVVSLSLRRHRRPARLRATARPADDRLQGAGQHGRAGVARVAGGNRAEARARLRGRPADLGREVRVAALARDPHR